MDATVIEWVFTSVPTPYILTGIMAACLFSFCLNYVYSSKKSILNHENENIPLVPQREVTYVENLAKDLCDQVSEVLEKLLKNYLDHGGWLLDYDGISNSTEYKEIKQLMDRFRGIKVERLPADYRKTFFINAYNFLTIDALVRNRKKGLSFWKNTAYELGGHVYSLDDMEHGVLRNNRCHPITKSEIPHDDPRTVATLELDPRIHAALNCGAKSCPKMRAYHASSINEELDKAAHQFCNDWVEIYEGLTQITVSKIFSWYKIDFGSNEELAAWLIEHLDEPKRTQVASLKDASTFKIKYASYDWATNEQGKAKI